MKRVSSLALSFAALMLAASVAFAGTTAPASSAAAPAAKPAATSKAKPAAAPAAVAAAKGARGAASTAAAAAPAAAAAATNLVDLNSATRAELMKLPGIGEAITDKIIKARPFANKSQLLSKGLVSKAVYDKLSNLVIAKQK